MTLGIVLRRGVVDDLVLKVLDLVPDFPERPAELDDPNPEGVRNALTPQDQGFAFPIKAGVAYLVEEAVRDWKGFGHGDTGRRATPAGGGE